MDGRKQLFLSPFFPFLSFLFGAQVPAPHGPVVAHGHQYFSVGRHVYLPHRRRAKLRLQNLRPVKEEGRQDGVHVVLRVGLINT